jgi:hypothetical protein
MTKKYTIAYYGRFNQYDTQFYISHALEEMGHTVIKLSVNSRELPDCDFRLFAKLETDWLIKKSVEPTVCWQFDLHRNFGGRSFDLPYFKAGVVVTTDGGDPYHTVRQGIHKPHKIMYSGEKIYDTIFVGEPYSQYRVGLIKRLRLKLVNNTRGIALNQLLAQTKIVVGDSAPADNYWSNRLYEITGRGGFLIHPVTIGMPDYIPQYHRGKEKGVVQHFLKNEEERELLRQIQFMNCPTYHDRVKEFLEIVESEL